MFSTLASTVTNNPTNQYFDLTHYTITTNDIHKTIIAHKSASITRIQVTWVVTRYQKTLDERHRRNGSLNASAVEWDLYGPDETLTRATRAWRNLHEQD